MQSDVTSTCDQLRKKNETTYANDWNSSLRRKPLLSVITTYDQTDQALLLRYEQQGTFHEHSSNLCKTLRISSRTSPTKKMWIISTIIHHSCVPRLWMTGILKAPHNLAELQILGFRDYHILIICRNLWTEPRTRKLSYFVAPRVLDQLLVNDQKCHDFLGGLMWDIFCMVGKQESLPSNIWCRGVTFHHVKNREEHHLKGNLGDLPVYTKLPFLQHWKWKLGYHQTSFIF